VRKNLSILGSTGSIGRSALDVVASFPDRFSVVALAAGRRIDLLAEQARRFGAKVVAVAEAADAEKLRGELGPGVAVSYGPEGLLRVALAEEADMVVSALVGAAGLVPTHAALEAGLDVALANKETLVVAGAVVRRAAERSGARILPVDSEHCAIFQALDGRDGRDVKRVVLTASGGPFRGRTAREMEGATPEEALRHPNWSMGPKITVDSATLMNKGLEVIEARWLFDLPPDRIAVTLHPQSIVHSMVEFVDGSILAQMGVPDMRGPIAYALAHPERLPMPDLALDLWKLDALTFEPPDFAAFPCLELAYEALEAGGTLPAVLSGANEVAVAAFLEKRIGFNDIARLVRETMEQHDVERLESVEMALAADRWARDYAMGWVRGREGVHAT
jgi:1-deoxy-D-xylulose-5-phosphate reductoisomerase